MGFVTSFPGRLGDLLFAVPVMRELVALYGEPTTLITSKYCRPALPVLWSQGDLLSKVGIDTDYRPTSLQPGLQPWTMAIPEEILAAGHVDVLHLGLRCHPRKGQTISECIGMPFQVQPKQGPWLKLASIDRDGPVITHCPVHDLDRDLKEKWLSEIKRLVKQRKSVICLMGPGENNEILGMGIDELPGVDLREMTSLKDAAEVCNGASSFVGIASAPAVVAAGMGLPSRWILRHGAPDYCIPRGCDVTVIK